MRAKEESAAMIGTALVRQEKSAVIQDRQMSLREQNGQATPRQRPTMFSNPETRTHHDLKRFQQQPERLAHSKFSREDPREHHADISLSVGTPGQSRSTRALQGICFTTSDN
jgi:hypothetical protein